VRRWRHQAPIAASMKRAMQPSEVARAPCARKVGQKAKKAEGDERPRGPEEPARPAEDERAQSATLKSAVIARAAISLGKWSSPVS
jgi:hypothetical protein